MIHPVPLDVVRYPVRWNGATKAKLLVPRFTVVLGATLVMPLAEDDAGREEPDDALDRMRDRQMKKGRITITVDDAPLVAKRPLAAIAASVSDRLMFRDDYVDPIVITPRDAPVEVHIETSGVKPAVLGKGWEVWLTVA